MLVVVQIILANYIFRFFSGVPLPLNRDNIYTVEKMVSVIEPLYIHINQQFTSLTIASLLVKVFYQLI